MKISESTKPDVQSTDRLLAAVAPLVPALLSFGPFLMFLGIQGIIVTQKRGGTPYLFDYLITLGGVLSLSAGLLFLFVRQGRIMQRLDELERQKTPSHEDGAGIVLPLGRATQ